MKINKDVALEMHLVLREMNAFFKNGTAISPSTMYSEYETYAQAVKRLLRATEAPVVA